MHKRILITGSTGFIGKEILSQINDKEICTICLYRKKRYTIKNKNIKWIKSSLILSKKNLKIIKKFKPEVIFHLAWDKIPNFSYENCLKNLIDSVSFFKKITKIKTVKKIIVSGSCFEYAIKNGKKNENEKNNPKDYFALSKYLLYLYLKKICKKKIKLAWFRLFYVYGHKQRKQSLIPYLIDCIKKNITIYLKTPNIKNDYIFVEDVAKVFIKALKINFVSGIYNLGTNKPISVNKIINILNKQFKKKIKIKKGTNNQKYSFYACMNKTKKVFKVNKFKTIDYGLKKILDKI